MTQTAEHFRESTPPPPVTPETVLEELDAGLIMRSGTPEDADALADFNQRVHANAPAYEHDVGVGEWTRDMVSGEHPRIRASDFVIVQDTKADRIAATLNLCSHRARYGRVEFELGQPEIVGTHPDYRRRGLVRRMLDQVHAWSAERGQLMQVIDGIPWYYRQFGYDMALECNVGRTADPSLLLEPASNSEYSVREATEADLPFLQAMHEITCRRHKISCVRDEALWRYELGARRANSAQARTFKVIERATTPVAAFAHTLQLRAGSLFLTWCEVAPGTPLQAISRPLLGTARRLGEAFAVDAGQPFRGVSCYLGRDHPIYAVTRGKLEDAGRGYAIYVRVPDLIAFLTAVGPELEARLAASAYAGYTGNLELNVYREGVRLVFAEGALTGVESWTPETGARGHVCFPDLTFLQLLVGTRSVDELYAIYPDCLIMNPGRAALTDALFPKQPSDLWATY